jgi:predicted amidohydrolase
VSKIPVALIQFDAIPEQPELNLERMTLLTERAISSGARWVMFHEGTVCDYTPKVADFAEAVPDGRSTTRMAELSRRLGCHISFGLSEVDDDKYYIAQVFVGPRGYVHHYRKTWIWREPGDEGYRNEWARYDPGSGPELFEIDGFRATCFICADGVAPRCIERVIKLAPQVVFYPNNRTALEEFEELGQKAMAIRAPMLVTNRVGRSWIDDCKGGCVIYSAKGEVLAKANRDGREEILIHSIDL